MTPLMEQAAFEMTADAGKEQELNSVPVMLKLEVRVVDITYPHAPFQGIPVHTPTERFVTWGR